MKEAKQREDEVRVVPALLDGQYWLLFPDGTQSRDTYNLTWAKDHKARLEENYKRMGVWLFTE